MANFEKFEPVEEISFDYEQAASLARERIELEGSVNKQKKSQIKNKIKELYGSADTINPEKTPAKRRIFDLELEKQRLFLALEEGKTEKLPIEAEPRPIWYDQEEQCFIARAEKGYQIKATLGDLTTDANWGIFYDLGEEVPEPIRQKYQQAVFQGKIRQLADQQLLIQRAELEKKQLDNFLLETYQRVKSDLERGGVESAGLLFEKMIYNLLSKIAIDLDKWGIKIEKASIIEDVELKIDFVIVLPRHTRGVGIEEAEKRGIQFTLIGAQSEEFRRKQRQVRRAKREIAEIDDLVLVSVPVGHEEIFKRYKTWQRQGKLPGGPENLFSPNEIIDFVKQILQNTELAGNEEFLADIKKYFEKKR